MYRSNVDGPHSSFIDFGSISQETTDEILSVKKLKFLCKIEFVDGVPKLIADSPFVFHGKRPPTVRVVRAGVFNNNGPALLIPGVIVCIEPFFNLKKYVTFDF